MYISDIRQEIKKFLNKNILSYNSIGKKSCFYWLKYGNHIGRPMYLTMNYDLAQSILLLTKIKVMKFPVSRRLKTWNNNIFTELCPFGCGVEDNEEHAFLNCKVTIIKDLKKVILDGLKEISIKAKLTKF